MTFLAEPRTVVHYFTSAPFAAVVQLLKGQRMLLFLKEAQVGEVSEIEPDSKDSLKQTII